ncbi:HAD family hydrolase [Bacillus cereus]|uniref:HAD family hydrolase n=1 Tax=Bacillus cereus TaxID=1396 RepID=UPI002ABF8F56|nr:HAD-IA family hydrolase [Bacillus cereus]MDZ4481526.1 HAD-IA family hydrolase [Bacillus cereus]MDZ4497376.1 HAD-IA family hydrolase [Bacillus cereus]MDZ4519244.1 HAD-IA family hydrolase [Bacillus cereus]MDZ4583428.1 HAD-IA family hydrolase [Bacillus cereus]
MDKKYVFFDLMETIVKPPDKAQKINWLKSRGINADSPGYEWLVAGFTQALFAVETGVPFAHLRDYYLVNDFTSIEDMALAAEQLSTSREKINQNTLLITTEYTKFVIENTIIYQDVDFVLGQLRKNGYSLCLISNLMSPYKKIVTNLKLKKWFEGIFYSCEVGYKKPDVRIFQFSMESTKVNSNEVVLVGDNWKSDILGALENDINVIFVNRDEKGVPNHLIKNGLKGLLEMKDGKIQIKRDLIPLISPYFPNKQRDLEENLIENVYKDSEGFIRLKSLCRVKSISSIRELYYLLIN